MKVNSDICIITYFLLCHYLLRIFFFSFQCKELKDARRKGGKKKKIEIDFFYKTILVRLTVQVNLT